MLSQASRVLQFVVPCSLFMSRSPQNKSTVLLEASLKTLSYHGELSTTFYFRSQNISLPQEPNMYNTLIKNHPQCATHYKLVQLCYIFTTILQNAK